MKTQEPKRLVDRFDEYARLKNITDSAVTKDAGLAVGTIGKSRKPGKDLSRRTCELLLQTYPDLSREWLMNGTGDVLMQPMKAAEGVPFIDVETAECGRPGGLSGAIMSADCQQVSIPGVPRGTDFFIRAAGYSMINEESPELSIPPGSLVGAQKLSENPFMRWGDVYVLSTPDGVMIKRLFQDDDPDYLRCVSYNKANYPEFRILKSDIFECARITCVVPVYVR